ncbi:MAG TPA: M28 family peptidase [Bacteroidales bacterium]|nr:M28 family peptidase [Bacteroidales bacterium]
MKNLVYLFLFCSAAVFAQKSDYPNVITAKNVRSWVSFLASDNMKGRANGSPEMKFAAEDIARHFEFAGLKPLGKNKFITEYSYSSRNGSINERNVIGYIEGSDPLLKNEYIVLSAHFDHIGISHGIAPDSINNGADDNATGTAALIGISIFLRQNRIKPGRSIVFAAFSGEENGMRGSRAFVQDPPIPLKSIYLNMNFEMIGHSEELGKGKYYMTGCSKSNLDDVIKQLDTDQSFRLVDTIKIAEMLFSMSDNISFSRIGSREGNSVSIPCLWLNKSGVI